MFLRACQEKLMKNKKVWLIGLIFEDNTIQNEWQLPIFIQMCYFLLYIIVVGIFYSHNSGVWYILKTSEKKQKEII